MDLSGLMEKIARSRYKVISFDIFDTLLVRPCLQPTDLLKIVGLRCGYDGNFLEMRRAAEKKARRDCQEEEIKYDDIYKVFSESFTFTCEEIEHFRDTELDVEMQYLYARPAMKEIFDFAVSIGKKVILVSDMYLSAQFLEKVLEKNGYAGFDRLYVSSEYGKTKSTGHLYDIVLEECARFGIRPQEILHMGDHEKSDVTIPESKNIKTVFIPRISWLLRRNKKLSQLYNNMERKLDNSFLIGFSANRTFNNPFRPYNPNTFFFGSRYSAANMLFAPFFLSFVKWMLEDCIHNEIDTLCMVYRDGYIPEKIYGFLRPYYEKTPKTVQIYLTRAMINRFYSMEKNGLAESIYNMRFSENMTVRKFITDRLNVSDQGQYQEVLDLFISHGYKGEEDKVGRRDELSIWIKELEPYFEQNSARSVNDIKAYCEEVLKECGRLAVYDVGYRGSVCTFLDKYLGRDSIGYHLFAKENLRHSDFGKDYFQYAAMYGMQTEKESRLMNCLTEDLLNADEASVNDVIRCEDGSFIMVRDQNYGQDRRQNRAIKILQRYILEYAESFSQLFQEDMRLLHFDITNYFEFYRSFLLNATARDTMLFRGVKLIDSVFMNPYARNVYRQWEIEHLFKTRAARVLFEMEESIREISKHIEYRINPTIIAVGNPKTLSKVDLKIIDSISKKSKNISVRLLMETTEHTVSEYAEWGDFGVDIISKIDLPRGYDRDVKIVVSEDMRKLIDGKEYLPPLIQKLYKRYPDMGPGYPEAIVCYWYGYFYKIIQLYDQEGAKAGFLVFDEASAMHQLLSSICRELDVSIEFVNKGNHVEACRRIVLEIKNASKAWSERKSMRIAICASMPLKGYSGGRTHALNLAECLSYAGNEVFFISRHLPMFVDEMKGQRGHEDIKFIKNADLSYEKTYLKNIGGNYLDYLVIVPHRDKNEGYYIWARNLAKRMNAKLVLLNYETPNWMNMYLKEKQNEKYWKPWREVCEDGCLVLCSDKESVKYAKQYYVDHPQYTKFDYWYPTINSMAAEKIKVEKENNIIAFVRPGAANKGTDDIFQILDGTLKQYKIVLICGSSVKDGAYAAFVKRLQETREKYGLQIELKMQPSDHEKFEEISKAKAMIFPSYFEGYGTPPIEAQYCNTMCLVYDLPVFRETCRDGVIYCEYGNVQDMKRKLLAYLAQEGNAEDLRGKVYEIANFQKCAERLDAMFRSHLKEDWRKAKL